ncbi:hypothetical protein PYCCODRAFT_1422386 [Trametes coccinea BRFM310]|uniref:Uncharacterized protein n=1 Tax=Trametes coccinea (strain BRFM310) TaxID=1353009 RepID=A0A1Y2J1Y3_TRAC3|nr:hypothetical protein PYCCODRAFT_1422386 [Trametes coccinea BRFM310]
MANKFKTHKADYFYRLIMQQSRRPASTRKVSRWNAFLSQELARRNNELPDGADHKRVSDDLIQDIAEKWRNMSEEEKSLATNDKVQEIYEQRANRAFGRHNVATREFNDLRRSLDHVETELRAIHSRTQAEILLIVTRGNQSTWMQPRTLVTSDAVEDFILSSTKYSVLDYSIKMECFILGGGANARSTAMSAKAQILKLKAEAASLIDEKLRAASRRGAVPGMKYSKFHRITEEFGIIVENWPLTRFCAPGDISSRTELEVLLHAWKTDSARFRCLSDDEWEEWRLRQVSVLPQPPSSTAVEETTSSPIAESTATPPSPAAEEPAPTSEPRPATGQKRPAAAVEFINTVTGTDGAPLVVAKRARKQRSDAGKKRGPQKKRAGEDAPATSTSALPAPASTTAIASPAAVAVVASPTSTTVVASPAALTLPASTAVSASPASTAVSASPASTAVVASPASTAVSASPASTAVVASPAAAAVVASPASTTLVASPAAALTSPASTTAIASPAAALTSPASTAVVASPTATDVVASPAAIAIAASPTATAVVASPTSTAVVVSPAATLTSPASTTVVPSATATAILASPASSAILASPAAGVTSPTSTAILASPVTTAVPVSSTAVSAPPSPASPAQPATAPSPSCSPPPARPPPDAIAGMAMPMDATVSASLSAPGPAVAWPEARRRMVMPAQKVVGVDADAGVDAVEGAGAGAGVGVGAGEDADLALLLDNLLK